MNGTKKIYELDIQEYCIRCSNYAGNNRCHFDLNEELVHKNGRIFGCPWNRFTVVSPGNQITLLREEVATLKGSLATYEKWVEELGNSPRQPLRESTHHTRYCTAENGFSPARCFCNAKDEGDRREVN